MSNVLNISDIISDSDDRAQKRLNRGAIVIRTCLVIFIFFLSANTFVMAETKTAKAKEDCSCTAITWQEAFEQASHVVFGEVKTVQNHGDALATADFKNLEVFKGEENHVTKIVGSAVKGGSCRAVLRSGFYLVFVKDSNTAVLNPCSQSRKLDDDLVSTLTAMKAYVEEKTPNTEVINTEATNQLVEKVPAQIPENAKEGSGDWWDTLMEWKQDILDWFEE